MVSLWAWGCWYPPAIRMGMLTLLLVVTAIRRLIVQSATFLLTEVPRPIRLLTGMRNDFEAPNQNLPGTGRETARRVVVVGANGHPQGCARGEAPAVSPAAIHLPVQGRICVRAKSLLKPLLFRGGVGVGSVPTRQGSVRRTAPTPLRLGSRLPSVRNPSPEEEGRL